MEVILNLAGRKEKATMDDAGERLRGSKQRDMKTDGEAGARSWPGGRGGVGNGGCQVRRVIAYRQGRGGGQKGNRRANSARSDRSRTQNGRGRLGQILGRSRLQRRCLPRWCSEARPEGQKPTVTASRFRSTKSDTVSEKDKDIALARARER